MTEGDTQETFIQDHFDEMDEETESVLFISDLMRIFFSSDFDYSQYCKAMNDFVRNSLLDFATLFLKHCVFVQSSLFYWLSVMFFIYCLQNFTYLLPNQKGKSNLKCANLELKFCLVNWYKTSEIPSICKHLYSTKARQLNFLNLSTQKSIFYPRM